MGHLMRFFSEDTNSKAVRSTALNPLQWGMAVLVSGLPAIIWAGAPVWLVICYAIGLGAVLSTFIFGFFFLLFKDRDALRSEQYSLSKLAIEHGLIGDSKTGLVDGSVLPKVLIGTKEGNGQGASEL